MTVDTSELRKLSADLATASGRVGREASAALGKAANAVRDSAKALAPARTGALRGSIEVMERSGDGRFASMSATIGTSIRYGWFNEFGTSKMAPQPYLGPALAANADAYVSAIEKIAEDLL